MNATGYPPPEMRNPKYAAVSNALEIEPEAGFGWKEFVAFVLIAGSVLTVILIGW